MDSILCDVWRELQDKHKNRFEKEIPYYEFVPHYKEPISITYELENLDVCNGEIVTDPSDYKKAIKKFKDADFSLTCGSITYVRRTYLLKKISERLELLKKYDFEAYLKEWIKLFSSKADHPTLYGSYSVIFSYYHNLLKQLSHLRITDIPNNVDYTYPDYTQMLSVFSILSRLPNSQCKLILPDIRDRFDLKEEYRHIQLANLNKRIDNIMSKLKTEEYSKISLSRQIQFLLQMLPQDMNYFDPLNLHIKLYNMNSNIFKLNKSPSIFKTKLQVQMKMIQSNDWTPEKQLKHLHEQCQIFKKNNLNDIISQLKKQLTNHRDLGFIVSLLKTQETQLISFDNRIKALDNLLSEMTPTLQQQKLFIESMAIGL